MQAFVHVGYSRADCSDAIPWLSSASLSFKKSHPVYRMQTAIVRSSSTCTALCSFFISCLSWKSCQTPVSSSDLCCKRVFEKLLAVLVSRGLLFVICFLMMDSSCSYLKKKTKNEWHQHHTHVTRGWVELTEESCLRPPLCFTFLWLHQLYSPFLSLYVSMFYCF